MLHEWVKAFHIVFVIAWMAGMLYLPRLYVYHADAPKGSQLSETFKLMEMRLLRIIVNPAMILTWALGLYLIFGPQGVGLSGNGWLHGKIVLVIGMTVFHVLLARWRKDFAADKNQRSAKFYRIVNEVPTLLMIAIVILAIVKPF